MVCKHIFLISFLNMAELIFIHTVKWIQVFVCNSHNLTSAICLIAFK